MNDAINELERISRDEGIIGLYDAEEIERKVRNTQLKGAKLEGIEEGKQEEKIEIAKNVEPVVKKMLEFNGELCTSKVRINTCSACERQTLAKKKSTWNIQEIRPLTTLFHKEFGRGDSINDDFQIFLNCTCVDYNDVLNIYKIVVVDNKKVPTVELLQEAYAYIK